MYYQTSYQLPKFIATRVRGLNIPQYRYKDVTLKIHSVNFKYKTKSASNSEDSSTINESRSPEKSNSQKSTKNHLCPYDSCDKAYYESYRLKIHLRTHKVPHNTILTS